MGAGPHDAFCAYTPRPRRPGHAGTCASTPRALARPAPSRRRTVAGARPGDSAMAPYSAIAAASPREGGSLASLASHACSVARRVSSRHGPARHHRTRATSYPPASCRRLAPLSSSSVQRVSCQSRPVPPWCGSPSARLLPATSRPLNAARHSPAAHPVPRARCHRAHRQHAHTGALVATAPGPKERERSLRARSDLGLPPARHVALT